MSALHLDTTTGENVATFNGFLRRHEMPRTLLLAALDIGTTNVKAEARVYVDGELTAHSTSPSEPLGFSDGIVRAGHFREAATQVLRSIFAPAEIRQPLDAGVRPRMAISQLGEAFFAIGADGEMLDGNLYTSQSPLGRETMESPGDLDLAHIQQFTARHCGVRADDEMTSIMLIDWLRANPSLRDRLVLVASAGGHLIESWTGQRATTMSVLGREGLANMHTGDISPPILEACGFNPLWFPRVARYGRPVAPLKPSEARRLGLPSGLLFYPQIHDQCAAYEGATALTGLDFGVRTILTGTSNGICAPSHGTLTDAISEAILHQGYCFYPGLRPADRMTLIYHLDGEPEETLLQRLAPDLSRSNAYEKLDRLVYDSYIVRRDPIQSTYIPCRLLSFPVNRFPEDRRFSQSFRPLPGSPADLTDQAQLRDSMAGKILFIRAGYEAHRRLLNEAPQERFIAYGGGHSKSIVEFQMYADILRSEIQVIRGETGLKGAMLTLLTQEERDAVLPSMREEAEILTYQPDADRVEEFDRIYPEFLSHLEELYPHIRGK